MTENSVSLTGCNRLTCKGDGKLFQHVDQFNSTSSDEDDGIFRNQRNFPTVNLTNSDDSDGTFRNRRNFPTVFCSMRRNFPTIFRQRSDSNLKSKAAVPGLDPPSFRITICYSTTAPHSLTVFREFVCQILFFASLCVVLLYQHCVNCVYLRQCCVFLRQYSVHLLQYCVFLRQYCVFLRQ